MFAHVEIFIPLWAILRSCQLKRGQLLNFYELLFKKQKKRNNCQLVLTKRFGHSQSGIQASGAHTHGGILICSTLCHWALQRLTNSGTIAIIFMIHCIIALLYSLSMVLTYLLYLHWSYRVMHMINNYTHHIAFVCAVHGTSLVKPRNSMKHPMVLWFIAAPRETLAWCCMCTFHPISRIWIRLEVESQGKKVSKRHFFSVNFHWTFASNAPGTVKGIEDVGPGGRNPCPWKIIQADKQMVDWQI